MSMRDENRSVVSNVRYMKVRRDHRGFKTIRKSYTVSRDRSNCRCKRTLDRFILLGQAASRSWLTGRAGFEQGEKKRTSDKIWLSRLSCEEAHYRICFFFLFFSVALFSTQWPWPMIDWLPESTKRDSNRHNVSCHSICIVTYRPSSFMRSHSKNEV